MLHNSARRLAAAGAVTALAAAGLVATTTTSASATPASATYTCQTSAGPQDIAINFDADALTLPTTAGAPIPAGSAVTIEATVSPTVKAILIGLSADDLGSSDLALDLGGSAVPVDGLHVTGFTDNPDGSRTYDAAGTTGDAKAPVAGDADLTTPAAFGLDVKSSGSTLVTAPCATSAPATLGSTSLAKQTSTTSASLAKSKIHKGDKAKVTAKVKGEFGNLGGTVKVLKGGNSIGSGKLSKGKVTITTKPFKKTGKFKLTVKYTGNGFAKGSQDTVTLKVVK